MRLVRQVTFFILLLMVAYTFYWMIMFWLAQYLWLTLLSAGVIIGLFSGMFLIARSLDEL